MLAKCLHSAEPRGQSVEESEEVVIQMKAQRAGKSSGAEVLRAVTQLLSSVEYRLKPWGLQSSRPRRKSLLYHFINCATLGE